MPELRGGCRVHFVLALSLCGIALLAMASTWLPGGYIVPTSVVIGLFALVFPVFGAAFVRSLASGAAGTLFGPANAGRLARYVWLLPLSLKLTYGIVICLALAGGATGGGRDAKEDASGYYYTYWNNTTLRSERVSLTEPEYHEALKAHLRVFSAGPALFYAASSFLVLASASASSPRPPVKPG
ncbi:hypothetical protein QMZ92_26530 [Streptomyces sp. HNM0645]|uniref:hypothetical protein n=1 Tax=Streptomyces sp. HNM0645 TaxID=2782343 RepID=UPI0024B703A9|nr:hypothetical protein [Streptomyces sp. HNM0645]MDI9887830.1 hypothetical protein [Streptomyces sp. HNM0645]